MSQQIIVIGSGFAGLSSACYLAKAGYSVTVLEKNTIAGGRARKFETDGFVFDMGPSWYWMPGVFDRFFSHFNKKTADYYDLIRLDPSYQIFFEKGELMQVPAQLDELYALFEQYEPGSSKNLKKFLDEAAYKYEVGINEFVQKPGHSILEFADLRVLKSLFRLQMFQSMSGYVRRLFKNDKLIRLLEFPVLFLGATPQKTPALYSLMNYADLALGTWYPKGGMHKIIEGMVSLAEELGVEIKTDHEVTQLEVVGKKVKRVHTKQDVFEADIVVGAADYNHVEQHLLAPEKRTYSADYWEKRTMAPSSLLFYLGVDAKLKNIKHHNLFFDADFGKHAVEIYEEASWPSDPLFYVCAPSVTDPTVAPAGKENLFVLIPLAPGLEDSEEQRERYFDIVMERLETRTRQDIRSKIIYKRSYAMNDFQKDYHAFKGNAYGLANTMLQTAFLKPKLRSKKVQNLFYAGQLTTPGPGVPPSLISGEVVSREIIKNQI